MDHDIQTYIANPRCNKSMLFILYVYRIFLFFFFFQAEDGIRDYKVTGVQTCALPISATWCASSPTWCATACRAPWTSMWTWDTTAPSHRPPASGCRAMQIGRAHV